MLNLREGRILQFEKADAGIRLAPLPTDFPVWSCECGSPLFYIATNGPMCARCLKMQEIPKPR